MQINKLDIINKNYILLDWNVIKYLKKPRNDTDKETKRLLTNVRKKYELPFCEAHLRDLARSFSENNKDKVNEDLVFLQELTQGTVLGMDENEKFLLTKQSVFSFFQEIINENPSKPNITPEMNPQSIIKVDMQKLDANHPMREELERTGGVWGPGIMSNWLNSMFDKLFDEIDDYKKYREYIKKLKRDLQENSQDGLILQDKMYREYLSQHMMPFLDALEIENSDDLVVVWKAVITKWLQMNYGNNIPFGEFITTAYVMLDLHPLFKEKLKKKKNTLSNITRDSKIVYYASNSKYFITEDNGCYEKIKFVYRALEIDTKVLKMSEFVRKFS